MLELYQSENCPYSKTVREKLSDLGLSYVAHNPRLPGELGGDVTNELTNRKLIEGGEDQIPYLVDTRNERSLYESEDIVVYLEEQYG